MAITLLDRLGDAVPRTLGPLQDQAAAAERRDELARQALTLMAAVGAASLVFSAYWDFGAYQVGAMSSPAPARPKAAFHKASLVILAPQPLQIQAGA